MNGVLLPVSQNLICRNKKDPRCDRSSRKVILGEIFEHDIVDGKDPLKALRFRLVIEN